ncbi:MAG: NapC/NirT family cytochrome c [Anaerolineae bacterium]|nr:NapC/NirT family cytochrome c [Anaerolineae bacterium]
MLQRLDKWLKKSKWRWLLLIVSALFVFWIFFMGSVTLMDWSESSEFCSSCHVMSPEHTAYKNSPHAKVECGTCHIGPGAYHAFEAKVRSAHYVWSYPLNLFEKPIPSPITSLRPAEVVCEQCHWPEKFYDDRLVVNQDYAQDEKNSLTETALVVNTGGGPSELGQGRGIHWHIENPVYYIATDEKRQDIPWVQATFNGITTTYLAADSNLTPEAIAKAEKRKMDCIDCHNRASHHFRNPDDALNEALALGQIASDLPYIKREGANVLMKKYATEEEAAKAIAAVEDFYKTSYPSIYASRKADVQQAVAGLQAIFDKTQFPFMNLDWKSHTNNIGHQDFPGCFRCHDGKHLSQDNQAIRLECNVCHSIPQVADPGKPIPPIEVSTAKEPATHKSTTWLAEHRYKFDATCAQCHTVDNPGGKDNSSFCSNSACHATEWVYAGLDAPKVRQLSAPPKVPGTGAPKPIPHPVGQRTDCLACHAAGKVQPYPENHASFKIDMCTQCHKPTLQEPAAPGAAATAPSVATRPAAATAAPTAAATPTAVATAAAATTAPPQATATSASAGGSPAIPHAIDDPVHKDCTLCHGQGKTKPFPANHTSFPVDICVNCHKPAQQSGTGSAPTAAPTARVAATATAAAPSAAATAVPATPAVAAPAAGGLKPIPHELAGRDNCLLCHNPEGGVKPAPKDHAGRTNEQCQACHKPKS